MSVRARVFLSMAAVAAVLTAANMGIALFFMRKTLFRGMGGYVPSAASFFERSAEKIWPYSMNATVALLAFGILAVIIASGEFAGPFRRMKKQNSRFNGQSETTANESEVKSKFIANMRHEMRKPLNSIVRLSEHMLGGEEIQGEIRDSIEKINNAGMTLLNIVNGILDFCGDESGKFEIMPVEYDVPSLINDIVALSSIRIGDKPIELNLHIDNAMPSKLFGDELRIELVCNNLLDNAFKYTREGKVDLSFECEKLGNDEWLTIRVADTGIGIRPEDLGGIFSNYGRNYNKLGKKAVRTDLSITRTIVAMMGGTLTAESEQGKGSVFTARIRQGFVTDVPIGEEVAKNLRRFHYFRNNMPDNSKLVRVQLPRARVLVVDDVEANLEIAKELLEHYGMQVDCLTSGRQAIIKIFEENVSYDAIFMDHMMPEIDGIETARIIREEIGTEYAKNIPIIALTASAATGDEKKFIEKGFQAFLSKPIDIIRLDAAVTQWLRNKDFEGGYAGNHGRLEQGANASEVWTPAGPALQGACTAAAGY